MRATGRIHTGQHSCRTGKNAVPTIYHQAQPSDDDGLDDLMQCSKNWAFLQNDDSTWEPAPFYDITFSPQPFAEHLTVYAGFGKNPSIKAIQQLTDAAGFTNWKQAQQMIAEIIDAIAAFDETAKSLGVKKEMIRLISQQLEKIWQENKGLVNC